MNRRTGPGGDAGMTGGWGAGGDAWLGGGRTIWRPVCDEVGTCPVQTVRPDSCVCVAEIGTDGGAGRGSGRVGSDRIGSSSRVRSASVGSGRVEHLSWPTCYVSWHRMMSLGIHS